MHTVHPLPVPAVRLPGPMLEQFMRCQQAAHLLSALNRHAALQMPGIGLDHSAALASYINDDLDTLLAGIEPACE